MGMKVSPEMEAKLLAMAGQAPAAPTPEADPDTEKAFQADVVKLAKRYGWRVYHTTISKRSAPGFPDLVLVRPPALIFAELKIPPNKVTPEQQEWVYDLRACSLPVFVWEPKDWPEIERTLL